MTPCELGEAIDASGQSGRGAHHAPTRAFAVGNSYALVLLTRQEGRATRWREAFTPLLAGVLVAVGELVALAAFRGWAETTLGARWPI